MTLWRYNFILCWGPLLPTYFWENFSTVGHSKKSIVFCVSIFFKTVVVVVVCCFQQRTTTVAVSSNSWCKKTSWERSVIKSPKIRDSRRTRNPWKSFNKGQHIDFKMGKKTFFIFAIHGTTPVLKINLICLNSTLLSCSIQ